MKGPEILEREYDLRKDTCMGDTPGGFNDG